MELALGTVQFGLAYGIAGRNELVPESEVREILEYASGAGIRLLDTAPGYGDIEVRLRRLCEGLGFKCVSKIPAIDPLFAPADAMRFVVDTISRSQDRLGEMLDTVLFHRPADLAGAAGGDIWEAASSAAAKTGVRLGISSYAPEEISALQARYAVRVVQAPGNAFDQRIHSAVRSDQIGKAELHLRSVFLQGLLLMPYELAVRKVPAAAEPLAAWHAWCAERGFSPLVGALGTAKANTRVRCVIVGVDSVAQLKAIVSAWNDARPMTDAALACTNPNVIDPRCWKVA